MNWAAWTYLAIFLLGTVTIARAHGTTSAPVRNPKPYNAVPVLLMRAAMLVLLWLGGLFG